MKKILIALLSVVTCVGLFAGSAAFSWTANPEPTVGGYELVYGINTTNVAAITNVINVGNVTSYTVTNLLGGRSYSFYIVCYSTNGVDGPPSTNTVTFNMPVGAVKAFQLISLTP